PLARLARTALRFLALGAAHGIPGLAFTFADPAALFLSVDEVRNVDLRHRNRDELASFPADHFPLRDVATQVLTDLAANDVPKPGVVLIDLEGHLRGWEATLSTIASSAGGGPLLAGVRA